MRVRRTGSSRRRRLTRGRSGRTLSARNRNARVRMIAVSSIAVGGGCCPHPGGDARAYTYLRLRGERPLRQPEDRARDDEPLNLARPLVDLRDLRVPVVALDRKLLRVAVTAENLDCFGRLPARHLRGEELRLRPRLGMGFALMLQPSSPINEESCGVDLRRHVRELPLHALEVGDSLPELAALERVRAGDVVRSLRDPQRLSGDADPAPV